MLIVVCVAGGISVQDPFFFFGGGAMGASAHNNPESY